LVFTNYIKSGAWATQLVIFIQGCHSLPQDTLAIVRRMTAATKRKHVYKEMLENFDVPKPCQTIVQV